MFARSLKPAALAILRPVTRALIRGRIHPNTLTVIGLGLSIAAGWLFAAGWFGWAATFLLLAGLFDMLDGAVARESSRATRYGAFLDSNVDRYAEIVVFAGILWWFQGDPWTQMATLVAISGSLMVSYTKARAEGLGEEVSGGLFQRPERIIILALGSYFGDMGLRVVVWSLAVLTNLTSVQRMLIVAGRMATGRETEDTPEDDSASVESADIEPAPPPA